MNRIFKIIFIVFQIVCCTVVLFSQSENVPSDHPIYPFLKRMELKGIIENYHDAVLPLSRREVASYLKTIKEHQELLTSVERDRLHDFEIEFQYELTETIGKSYSLFHFSEPSFSKHIDAVMSEGEKFLYVYADTNLSFWVNGLLTIDARRSQGDALGNERAAFVQFGGRIRGSIYQNLGYYIQGTNAKFWGSRDVLRRDKYISQAYTLNVLDAQNFDIIEGYVRYAPGIVSLQVGRERLLWGLGYGDKMIASDNVRHYDFIRADAQYKSLKYTFLHGWLLGRRSHLSFQIAPDTFRFSEPFNADKYFAAHRLEFSFPSLFDVGFQEMVIYSNRSVDLAYLNPVTLIESAQRARDERDNVLWALDVQTHFLRNLEFQGTILFDDINFPKWGTNSIQNKFAYQVGMMAVDPFGVHNTSVMVEYTRIEPFTFSHHRSRDNDYGSNGKILSHHIGPNSDSWFFRTDYFLTHNLFVSLRYETQRKGENIYGANQQLIKNAGGDILQPHRRGKDPETKEFLGGNLVRTNRFQAFLTYEIVNEVFFDVWYRFEERANSGLNRTINDHDYGIALRVDF